MVLCLMTIWWPSYDSLMTSSLVAYKFCQGTRNSSKTVSVHCSVPRGVILTYIPTYSALLKRGRYQGFLRCQHQMFTSTTNLEHLQLFHFIKSSFWPNFLILTHVVVFFQKFYPGLKRNQLWNSIFLSLFATINPVLNGWSMKK